MFTCDAQLKVNEKNKIIHTEMCDFDFFSYWYGFLQNDVWGKLDLQEGNRRISVFSTSACLHLDNAQMKTLFFLNDG